MDKNPGYGGGDSRWNTIVGGKIYCWLRSIFSKVARMDRFGLLLKGVAC